MLPTNFTGETPVLPTNSQARRLCYRQTHRRDARATDKFTGEIPMTQAGYCGEDVVVLLRFVHHDTNRPKQPTGM